MLLTTYYLLLLTTFYLLGSGAKQLTTRQVDEEQREVDWSGLLQTYLLLTTRQVDEEQREVDRSDRAWRVDVGDLVSSE